MGERDILLVEDDDAVRTAFEHALLDRGCSVDIAGDGITALAALSATQYKSIVLDLRLPKISGSDVLHRISDLSPRPLVFVLSAVSDEVRRAAGHQCVSMSIDKGLALQYFDPIVAAIVEMTRGHSHGAINHRSGESSG
jgi:DNA-binding response OmpR family regulator